MLQHLPSDAVNEKTHIIKPTSGSEFCTKEKGQRGAHHCTTLPISYYSLTPLCHVPVSFSPPISVTMFRYNWVSRGDQTAEASKDWRSRAKSDLGQQTSGSNSRQSDGQEMKQGAWWTMIRVLTFLLDNWRSNGNLAPCTAAVSVYSPHGTVFVLSSAPDSIQNSPETPALYDISLQSLSFFLLSLHVCEANIFNLCQTVNLYFSTDLVHHIRKWGDW